MRLPAPGTTLAAALVALAAVPALVRAQAVTPARGETAAAREQARLCERLDGEEAVAACREALALGIGPARRGAVRQLLSLRLATLERWDELSALLRESVRLDPRDADSWRRLGDVLLFGLGQPADAVPALEEAVRLAPDDAHLRVDLAVALASAGRLPEAVAAAGEAARLDPTALESRPGARAVLD